MSQGAFCWYELATTDPQAARVFYADVIGWQAEEVPEMHYTLLKSGDAMVGGLMALPDHVRQAGIPPHWIAYVAVDDVDQYTQRSQSEGATLHHGPADIPGVGRFAIITDPQGAPITLFKGTSPQPPAVPGGTPGQFGWHELRTTDLDAGFTFYASLFGWTRAEAIDMGPMGTYQMFAHEGITRGGMMKTPAGTHPCWLLYINVDAIDRVAQRAQLAGGMILQGAHQVPGGSWIAHLRDPQGADIAIVSPTR